MNNRIRITAATILTCILICRADDPGSTLSSMAKRVSISVQETDMVSVLRLISEQSGNNVVVGPDVAETKLNIDIKDVTLIDALDVILKPYGYGYHAVGNTIVVDKLDNLRRVASVEPLQARVFKLKYLDAADIIEMVKGMLSERGTCEALYVAPKRGWEFSQGGKQEGLAKLSRTKADEKNRASTKTLIVNDIPPVLTQIENMLSNVDEAPRQIEISSYFIEMKSGALFDLGVDWQMNFKGSEYQTGKLYVSTNGLVQTIEALAGSTTDSASPFGFPANTKTSVTGTSPYNAGLNFGLLRAGSNVDLATWLHAVEENGDINVLSAPRVMTQDNQEASIIVGRKVPIISTESEGEGRSFSTELEYYERIGIQLNVVPQICDDNRINMVVHPSVTEQDGVAKASVATVVGVPTTEFPIIQTREVETRLTLAEGETVAIGGLISDRQVASELKVPLLGDIPLIKHLFRRDISHSEKIELMILLSATICDEEKSYNRHFDPRVEQSKQKLIEKWALAETAPEPAVQAEPLSEPVASEETAPETTETL